MDVLPNSLLIALIAPSFGLTVFLNITTLG